MDNDDLVRIIGALQICAGFVIAGLAINEMRYFRTLWLLSQDALHTERSFLLGSILRLNTSIIIACVWFMCSITIRLIWGPQTWTSIIGMIVIIYLLIQPRLIGRTLRERARIIVNTSQDERNAVEDKFMGDQRREIEVGHKEDEQYGG